VTQHASAGLALQNVESNKTLGHLQQSSRIAASTWRRWCELLHLSPVQASELWEEVCLPLEKASGQRPNISYLMRLRAARTSIDIQQFKEEVAPIRHLLSFFRLLDDEDLGHEELSTAVLRYYKFALGNTLRQQPFERFIDQFSFDICRAFLIAKLARSRQVSLSRVLHLLAEDRADLERLVQLALQGGNAEGGSIARFLRLKEQSADALFTLFANILRQLYSSESKSDPGQQESRLRALQAFAPRHALFPSTAKGKATRAKGSKRASKKQAIAA